MDTRFTSLFTHSKDIFFVMDMNGVILHTNYAFRNTFNYTDQDLAGLNIASICHPADKERQAESQASLLLHKKLVGYQSRVKAKDGCYFSIIWSVILNEDDNLIYSSGNTLAGMVGQPENDIVQHTIQGLNEGFAVLDSFWNITAFNPAFHAMTNLSVEMLKEANFMQIENLGLSERVANEFQLSLTERRSIQVQYLNTKSNGWLRINVYPYKNQLAIFIRDITEIKMQEWVLELEKGVLELNATAQYTLGQTTRELLRGIERIFPDMVCSVLEVDDQQEKMHVLAAPRLSQAYCDLLEGLPVGPDIGSCGRAVYHREQVIVSDIENNPLWDNYAHMVRPYGLKACWSTPVMSSKGSKVLAVFGIYYHDTREPSNDEQSIIERTVNILRVLIESKKTEDNIREQNNRLQTIANISSHELRKPVATILGLVNLFDNDDLQNPLNKEIIEHIDTTSQQLDGVIHSIVERTAYIKAFGADA
ncbi:PAS domain S-box protein [Mucilaginibacter endophyticus]|uniref:PAS domain S-box protein n=1 Tax=Mucilaginibacter endophyticus TaxID=2675003 RepID=UPI000E0DD667|nr:PAS domain S-box protein [Mucilaginibacter endophyticus]